MFSYFLKKLISCLSFYVFSYSHKVEAATFLKKLISCLSFYIFSYSHKVEAATNIEVVLLDLKTTYFLVNTSILQNFKSNSITEVRMRKYFFSLIDECYFQDVLSKKKIKLRYK